MKKKVLAMLMAGMLCIASLAACGDDNSSGTGGDGNNSSTGGGGGSSAEGNSSGEGNQDADGGQGSVSSLPDTLENPNLVIVWNMTEDIWNQTLADNPNAFNLVWSTKAAFEEKYGGTVTVEGVDWGSQQETVISKVNAGEVCDLAEAHDQNFPIYGAKNIVQDISQYIDLSDDFWYDSVTEAFTVNGKPYAAGAAATPVVIYYNKTLFDQNGVKTPKEYYNEDNWTWNTFREVAMSLTGDTNGDGENDIWGFGWWDSFYVQMLATNGLPILNYSVDPIASNYQTPAAKEAFSFLQDGYLTDKYIVNPESGDFVSQFKNGTLAMTCEYGFGGFNVYECDYEIDWVPLPAGPSGAKYDCGGSLTGFSIPITSANPEGAAVFIRMAYELKQDVDVADQVAKYGQDQVDLMNTLGGHLHFAPIGLGEQYWSANWTIRSGLLDGTPISTFAQQADESIKEAVAVTMGQ